MARIRTIKPEFFRHGELQDLETANPGKHPMLVFAGLWCHCDKNGRFALDPRQLKLDILPFMNFDMAETIALLEGAGFIRRYEADGKSYGAVPTFSQHQRISGKESENTGKHPAPSWEATGKHQGSTREATRKQPGAQEREEEEEEVSRVKTASAVLSASAPTPGKISGDGKMDLYALGRRVLGANGGGLVGSLLKALDDGDAVREVLTTAATKAAPAAWVGKVLSNRAAGKKPWGLMTGEERAEKRAVEANDREYADTLEQIRRETK